MDFKNLADIKDLHEKTLAAAAAEKAATYHLLECLHEVDRKRAYLDLGYASLFLYVHRALGYSESQSFERIEAMRLSFRVDVVGASLKSGELTMTAVAKLAVHAKREKLAAPDVAELTKELAHKSVREVENVLVARATVPVTPRERMVPAGPTASRLDLVVDDQCAELLREARELDADPGVAMAVIVKRALRMYVDEKRRRKYGETKITHRASVERSKSELAAPEVIPCEAKPLDSARAPERSLRETERRVAEPCQRKTAERSSSRDRSRKSQPSRYIARQLRQETLTRAECQCEFRSLITGLRCTQKTALQLDHKFPRALNGPNTGNLQVLCSAHNRAKGMRT